MVGKRYPSAAVNGGHSRVARGADKSGGVLVASEVRSGFRRFGRPHGGAGVSRLRRRLVRNRGGIFGSRGLLKAFGTLVRMEIFCSRWRLPVRQCRDPGRGTNSRRPHRGRLQQGLKASMWIPISCSRGRCPRSRNQQPPASPRPATTRPESFHVDSDFL